MFSTFSIIKYNNNKKTVISIFIAIFFLFSGNFTSFAGNVDKTIESSNLDDIIYLKSSNLEDIIYLKGNSEEIGRSTGILLKDSIQKNIKNYWCNAINNGYSRSEIMEIVKMREKHLQSNDPEMILEIRAMAKAAEVSYDDLLAFNLYTDVEYVGDDQDHECTTWIAHGNASLNGNNLFHKNRDLSRNTQVIVNVAAFDGNNGYKAQVTAGFTGVSWGINDKGLVVGNNKVSTSDINVSSSTSSLRAQRDILKKCNSTDDVFSFLDDIFAGSGLNQGSNQLAIDSEKAVIIEHTGYRRCSKSEANITNDIGYRSNYFIVLDEYNQYSVSEHSLTRYEDARDFLEVRKGNLTPIDFNELSRYHRMLNEEVPSEHDGDDGSISNNSTISGGTIEVDKEFPGELSVMWTAIGTPCTALYTPIHIGSTTVSTKYTSEVAWNLSENIRNKQDDNVFPFGSLVPFYLEIESKMMQERESIKLIARDYILDGNTSKAIETLSNFDNNKADFVYKEMSLINEKKMWQDSFNYKNAINFSTNINWNKSDEYMTLKEIIGVDQIITYDFNGINSTNSTFNVYEEDVDHYPYLSNYTNKNTHIEALDLDYEALWAPDDIRWQTTDPGINDESFIWIEMKVNEDINEIEELQFTFEGYSAEYLDSEQAEFRMYLLRYGENWVNDSSWHRLGSRMEILNGTDKIMKRSLTSNFEEFVGFDGSITWIIGTPHGHSEEIFCDYVKLDVIKKPTSNRVYELTGEIQSIEINYQNNWDQYIFTANHVIPAGTNIIYKIQDSEGNNLTSITAAEAEVGYKLINLNTQIIRLYAKLLSSDGLDTPILKDWTVKAIIINIVNPIENEIFGVIAPNFTVEVIDPDLNTMWYTIDGGINNYTFTENETIYQEAWHALPEGVVSVRFYANNTFGNINFNQVNVIKDSSAPTINIVSPTENKVFGVDAPSFSVEITDPNLDTMWYTIDGGINNYTFTGNETIYQEAWHALPEGDVILKFYANDTLTNLASEDIIIGKSTPSGAGPDNTLIIILASVIGGVAAAGVVLGILIKKRKRSYED